MLSFSKRSLSVGLVVLVGGMLALYCVYQFHQKDSQPVIIILSPHFDDAVLSLGGYLAQKHAHEVVATFFTNTPAQATTTSWDTSAGFKDSSHVLATRVAENKQALKAFGAEAHDFAYPDDQYGRDRTNEVLKQDLSRDIQSLIASFGKREIFIYGPAIFTEGITHPDHKVLHQAYTDVIRGYPKSSVHFFFYEDYPYIEKFNRAIPQSLEQYLEDETQLPLKKVEIPLQEKDIEKKVDAVEKYVSQMKAFSHNSSEDFISNLEHFTTTHCGVNPDKACEVVYKVTTN